MNTNKMKALCAVTAFLCLFLCTITYAQTVDSSSFPATKTYTLYSKILHENRKISIRLPAGGDRFTQYPVLYLLDAEAQWPLVSGQVQYLSESYKIIPAMIIVGIENTDRMRDLTPTQTDIGPDGRKDTSARSPFKNSGGGENFIQFIRQELMPFIEQRYKTAPFRAIAGHSLGGLMALYCMLEHPGYFNASLAISPSLQWDNNALLKKITATGFPKQKQQYWLFFSDAFEDALFHQNQVTLDSVLKAQNSGIKYKRLDYPEESHISEPVKAFYDGIRFIYPKWHLPYNSSAFRKTMTYALIREHYAKLSTEYGYQVVPPHDEAIQIARFLRNDPSRITDALDLLQWTSNNYPSSTTVLEILGDTWMKQENKNNALDAYRKLITIDPANESVKQKINTLSNK